MTGTRRKSNSTPLLRTLKLIELAFPPAARGDTRERALALCAALGKTPVEVPDVPGFVVGAIATALVWAVGEWGFLGSESSVLRFLTVIIVAGR